MSAEVAQEIIACCQQQNIPCSKFLASFIAQSFISSSNDEDQVISKSVQRIMEKGSVSLDTIKMQISFEVSRFTHDKEILKKREKIANAKHEMILKLVSSSTFHSSDIKKLEKYRNDIFLFVLKFSVLLEGGDENKDKKDRNVFSAVEKEITAAFDSVLPLSAIKSFIFFTENEKKTQLQELPRLILGMRINNKILGKGGAGIQDVDEMCQKKSITLLNLVELDINDSLNICDQLKEKIIFFFEKNENGGDDDGEINVIDTVVKRWIDEHTFWKQYLYSMQSMKRDIEQYITKLVNVRHEFHSIVSDLQKLLKKRTTIPKEHIYPKCITVASIWETLHLDYYNIVVSFTDRINELWKHKNMINISISSCHQKCIQSGSSINNEDKEGRNRQEEFKNIPKHDDTPVRIFSHSTPNYIELPLEYNGYCCWTITHKHRLLDLGNPEVGLVKYKGKYYTFIVQHALESFMKHPMRYLDSVQHLALCHCELIQLLSLQLTFPKLSLKNIIFNFLNHSKKVEKFSTKEKMDKGVQCPTHFRETIVDPTYYWNEWEVRKNS